MLTALFLSMSTLLPVATPDSVCGVQPAPSAESFEDSVWQIGAVIFGDPGGLDPCWSRSDTTGFYWTPFVGITSGGYSDRMLEWGARANTYTPPRRKGS